MKNILIPLVYLFVIQLINAQRDVLTLLVEAPIFKQNDSNFIRTGFMVKSDDKRFVSDYYEFEIFNIEYSKKDKDIKYLGIDELRVKVSIDTIKYETVSGFTKDKKWWEVHNQLSLKETIFLLEKRKENFNSETGKYDYNYYIIPLIYTGTRKNIVPTDLSDNN